MGVKTNRTSFLCGSRNGHHNTELKTWIYSIWQHKQNTTKTSKRNSANWGSLEM